MLPIVNARGIPGSLGALARASDGARYFVTCNHVLYGAGAAEGDTVWALDESGDRRAFVELGRTVRGFFGRVTYDGDPVFIDCALGKLDDASPFPSPIREAIRGVTEIAGVARTTIGGRVAKTSWVTGRTRGTIVDVNHFDRWSFDGRWNEAPGQILIRPEGADQRFSAEGESGAAVVDEANRIVGFLWGCNANGDGIAFPAVAALEHFGLVVECCSRTERRHE